MARGRRNWAKQIARSRSRVGTIDLHGHTVAEAEAAIMEAINKALLDDLEQLDIVHGIGSGKVRAATHRLLSSLRVVAHYRLSALNPGVTEVFF